MDPDLLGSLPSFGGTEGGCLDDQLVEGDGMLEDAGSETDGFGEVLTGEIGRLALHVLAGLRGTVGADEDGVQRWAAVAAADEEGRSPGISHGLQDVLAQAPQVLDMLGRWRVVDAVGLCRSRSGKFG